MYYQDKKIPYEPFTGVMIDESQTSPAPDILLFDYTTHHNVVIIEVSSKAGMKKDFEKIKILAADYEVPEAFVYEYSFKTWRKYQPEKGEITDCPSFCEAIGMDLAELLKEM